MMTVASYWIQMKKCTTAERRSSLLSCICYKLGQAYPIRDVGPPSASANTGGTLPDRSLCSDGGAAEGQMALGKQHNFWLHGLVPNIWV